MKLALYLPKVQIIHSELIPAERSLDLYWLELSFGSDRISFLLPRPTAELYQQAFQQANLTTLSSRLEAVQPSKGN